MKNFLIPTLTLFLLVFASCQKEELETTTEQVQTTLSENDGSITTRSAEVPFKASFKTTVQTIGFNGGIITLNIDGTGKATHIGKSTMHSISTVNTNGYPWTQTGPQEITAANGHKLYGNYVGIGFPQQDGSVTFSGDWYITSGTGNYQGVTGSGTYEGSAVPAEGVGEITFDGTLSGL
jgi:hypothetical protein